MAERPRTVWELTKIMEAKQRIMEDLKFKHSWESSTGTQWNNKAARRDFLALKEDVRKINAQIASMK